MTSASFISLRRYAGLALIPLLLSFCAAAAAQTTPPLVTASFATKMSGAEYQTVWNVGVSSHGDLLVMDFETAKLYQVPADGRPLILLATLPDGGWANPGIAIDANDTIYIGNGWAGNLARIPYDAVAKTWNVAARTTWGGDAISGVGWYHADPMAINSHGLFVFGIENPSNTVYSVTLDASGAYEAGTATPLVTGLKARPKTIAVDEAGNVYFTEDDGNTDAAPGVFRIPADASGLTGESSLTRVDSAANPVGVAVDKNGNVYVSDSKKGVYIVPNENGTPNTSHTYLLTPLAAATAVTIDAKGALYVPVTRPRPSDSTKKVFDLYKVISGGDLGVNVTAVKVYFAFNGDASPGSMAFLQNGVAASFVNFAGTCSTDPTHVYHAGDSCTATATFAQAGAMSGQIAMLDAHSNVLGSSDVQAVALGAVKTSFATKMTGAEYQTVWNVGVSSHGDLLVMDFETAKLYQVPADGRPLILLATLPDGGWANPGIAIDANDTIYIGNGWAGNLARIPYDAVAKTWNVGARTTWGGDAISGVGWYHADPMAINSHGLFVFGIENPSNTVYSVTLDASGAYVAGSATPLVTGLKARPKTIAVDEAGNVYFTEDDGNTDAARGAFRIPAGASGLTGESSLTRVDTAAGADPVGVAVDKNGNVYVSDSKKGVYVVPNENGIPNAGHTYLLVPRPAGTAVAVAGDGTLYVPVTRPRPSDSTKKVFDVYKVTFGGNLGANVTTVTVYYAFNGDVSPASFAFLQGGTAMNFAKFSGACSTDPANTYHAGESCSETVTFEQPGSISGELVLRDGHDNILGSSDVSGVTLGFVKATFAVAMGPHTAFQNVWNMSKSSQGDIVAMDFQSGAVYHFPADGRAEQDISLGLWGWTNPGVAIDFADALYLGNQWSGGMSRIPYDAATKGWKPADINAGWAGDAVGDCCGVWWYHPTAIAANANGLLAFGIENPSNTIFSLVVDANGNVDKSKSKQIVTGLGGRPRSIAVDNSGNVYFLEDGGSAIYRVPAGTTGVDGESSLMRMDELAGVSPVGVAVDSDGNVYISDSKKGVYVVPNEDGLPNTAHTYLLTPVPAQGTVAVDRPRGALFVPTTRGAGWNGISDLAKVILSGDLGTAAVGVLGNPFNLYYAFSGDVTPTAIAVTQAGANPDFAITGGTCNAGTAYHAGETCSVALALNARTAGFASAEVVAQGAEDYHLASSPIHGVAQGAVAAFMLQPVETTIGSGLASPRQIAADAMGNIYAADSASGKVFRYNGNGAASVGTGLTAPTGVAVAGGGTVFIADSGNLLMVPFRNAGLQHAQQKTILTGLGAGAKLAIIAAGNVAVADPANQRVLKIIYPGADSGVFTQQVIAYTGFAQLTAIGVDGSGNLLVADGANLIQIAANGTRTTLSSELSGVNGLAMEVSGALYVSQADGAFRVPYVEGTFNFAQKLARGTGVTTASGIALDRFGNLVIGDSVAQNLHLVSTSGVLDFGTLKLGDAPTLNIELFNLGNAPFTVTTFTSNNAVDFTATGAAGGCDPAVPLLAAGSCMVAATMNPGPGEEGALSGAITVDGAPNAPVYLNVSGTGAALAQSLTTVTVDPKATALSIPVTVTVAPAAGTGVPTGQVTLSVDGVTAGTATLSNGSALIQVAPPRTAANHTFTASYNGDRTYGRSTGATTFKLAKGATQMALPIDIPKYVLSSAGGVIKSDNTADPYYYHLRVQVVTGVAGAIPTGKVIFMEGSSPACGFTDPTNSRISVTIDPDGYADWNTNCLAVDKGSQWTITPATQHVITAVYNGDANYASSTSANVTLLALRNPSVAITPGTMSLSVSQGSTASTSLTLTSVSGYGVVGKGAEAHLFDWTGPVEMQCNGLPAHTSCSFSPAQVDVNVGVPGTVVMTVRTNAGVGTVARRSNSIPVIFAGLFGFGLVGLVVGRKTKYHGRALMMICVLLIVAGAVAGISACGGSNTSKQTAQLTSPAGSYAVTVSAKQVFSQNWVSLPYTFTLNVK